MQEKYIELIQNYERFYEMKALNESNIKKTCSDEMGELFAALAKAQSDMLNAEKNLDNTFRKSTYADLSSVLAASRPYLTKCGLCVIQYVVPTDDGQYLVSRLGHSSGQWIESRAKINPKDADIQSWGAYITYLRRYLYSALVGVSAGSQEDDDGNRDAQTKCAPKTSTFISPQEIEAIKKTIGDDKDLMKDVLAKAKIDNISQLPRERFQGLMTWLEGKNGQ